MSEETTPPARGVLLAHGDMARGMVDAVRKISGAAEDALIPLSNEGLSPSALREALAAHLGDGPAVIFTDLQGGSCAMAAATASRRGRTAVVCGANLPMLLDFVFNRRLALDELRERLEEKGRQGIRSLGVPPGGGG